jgi:hypothetical protein
LIDWTDGQDSCGEVVLLFLFVDGCEVGFFLCRSDRFCSFACGGRAICGDFGSLIWELWGVPRLFVDDTVLMICRVVARR